MSFLSAALDLLYPPKCVFCGRLLDRGGVCICPRCMPTVARTSGGGKQSGDFFTNCIAPLYYTDSVREAVVRYKFSGRAAYADTFAVLLAQCVAEYYPDGYELISWVPLSAKRLKERGYDQARLLAESAAKILQQPVLRTLIKHRHVPAQSGMGDAEKRRANISGAYSVADEGMVSGRNVLLIDDVVTTGSTFSECARILKMAGAGQVLCAALARAKD